MPLLEGLDGVEKMSKSLGNYVGINEPAREIYGKVMSVSDVLMWRYWELCTDESVAQIAGMRRRVEAGELHPKQAKSDLARRIVADYHGQREAENAAAEFEKVFARKETPEEIKEIRLPPDARPVWVPKLLVTLGMAKSNGEARRLIEQGGVSLDGERLADASRELAAAPASTYLFKVGKRHFVRVRFD
jgi:tyrosyl-tRNA synthetase